MATSTWQEFDEEAEKVAEITNRQIPDICALIQDGFSVLADGFKYAEAPDASDSSMVRMALFTQNLGSLKCSIDFAMRGYYTQSINLLRGVYENWIAFLYVHQKPSEASLWLNRKKRPPGHSQMLEALGNTFPSENARKLYRGLCRFAHTDPLVVLPHLGNKNGDECVFFGAKYKKDLFCTCAYAITLLTSTMIADISQWINLENPWRQSSIAVINASIMFIEKENSQNEETRNKISINL